MTATTLRSRVLIVGAGPIGKTAALLLARYRVAVTLLEKGDGLSDEPKAISVDDEALRIYQQAGIIDEVLRIIVPGLGTYYFDSDSQPMFLGGSPKLGRFGYPFKNPFSQPELEHVLHRALVSASTVTYLTHHEVTSIHQDDNGVTATATTPDGEIVEFTGDYLIGADGGRSQVRAATGVRMSGRNYPDTWLVIDTTSDPHDERYGLHYGDPRRPHVIVPGRDGRCRYEFPVTAAEGTPGETPSLELIQRLVAPYRQISADQVERAVIYRFNALNAHAYQVGRVFLAGDAAHMMPPFAGQGLNSGLRDVFNLCWKLTQTLSGVLTPDSLASYDSERRPQAGEVVAFSERLGRVVMTENPRIARGRDRIIREQLQDPQRRAYFEGMGYRPPLTLRDGLLCRRHRAARAGGQRRPSAPGVRPQRRAHAPAGRRAWVRMDGDRRAGRRSGLGRRSARRPG